MLSIAGYKACAGHEAAVGVLLVPADDTGSAADADAEAAGEGGAELVLCPLSGLQWRQPEAGEVHII